MKTDWDLHVLIRNTQAGCTPCLPSSVEARALQQLVLDWGWEDALLVIDSQLDKGCVTTCTPPSPPPAPPNKPDPQPVPHQATFCRTLPRSDALMALDPTGTILTGRGGARARARPPPTTSRGKDTQMANCIGDDNEIAPSERWRKYISLFHAAGMDRRLAVSIVALAGWETETRFVVTRPQVPSTAELCCGVIVGLELGHASRLKNDPEVLALAVKLGVVDPALTKSSVPPGDRRIAAVFELACSKGAVDCLPSFSVGPVQIWCGRKEPDDPQSTGDWTAAYTLPELSHILSVLCAHLIPKGSTIMGQVMGRCDPTLPLPDGTQSGSLPWLTRHRGSAGQALVCFNDDANSGRAGFGKRFNNINFLTAQELGWK